MNNNNSVKYRFNESIKGVKQVRLIDNEGNPIGILSFDEALATAYNAGFDLVEISRKAYPPVCKLVNYDKFRYDLVKSAKEAKKKQHVPDIKEVTIRPSTDTNDLYIKSKHIKSWFDDGDKVKVIVRMKGRERVHPEQCTEVINTLLEYIGPHNMESAPHEEGRSIVMLIAKSA